MASRRCFLTFVDLLGFSSVVATEEELHVPISMVRRFQRISRSVLRNLNDQRQVHGLDRGKKSRIRVFSDLLLAYTEGDSHDDCIDMLETAAKIFRLCCETGLLARGAIAWGDLEISSSITLGKPIVEAHQLEHDQEWAGITLCDSMLDWNRAGGLTGDQNASILTVAEESRWLVRWPVPTKSRPIRERLAVNWLLFDTQPFWHSRFTDPPNGGSSGGTAGGSDGGSGGGSDGRPVRGPDARARAKLMNTEAFYRHLVSLEEGA